jgi:hypothetical protein
MAYHRWNEVATDLLIYFSKDDAWAYVTAMRGPDDEIHGDNYKRLVTAIIRGDCTDGRMLISDGAYGMHNFGGYNYRTYTPEELINAIKNISSHCVFHSVMGIASLEKWYKKQNPVDEEAVSLLIVMHRTLYDMSHGRYSVENAEVYLAAFYKFFAAWTGEKE